MKNVRILLFSLLALAFAGCSDDLLDVHFGLNTKDVVYTIQPTSTAGDIILDPRTQALNLDSLAQANGVNLGKVKEVRVKSITAILDAPTTSNFDLVTGGFIKLEAPGLPQVNIAEFTHTADGSKEFPITPADVNLLEYGKQPSLTVSGKLTTTGPLTTPHTVRLRIEFEVTANPLN